MHAIDFRQVDVFTSRPFKGNPVAVIMDARALSSDQMQAIAHWTNLSETTFVLPAEDPQADYRVRIFTPQGELPFAGHPTLGTAHALIEAGRINPSEGRLIQECDAGLITLTVNGNGTERTIAFDIPHPRLSPLDAQHIDRLEELLCCRIDRTLTPVLVDIGIRWIVASTVDAQTVISAQPDFTAMTAFNKQLNATGGISLFGSHAGEHRHIEVRSFAPSCGVNEDPVCGSGNGSVAAFIRHYDLAKPEDGPWASSQGQCLGRDGHLELTIADDRIQVGGHAVTCISGTINV